MANKTYILPYLRKGLSSFISEDTSRSSKDRPKISVKLNLNVKNSDGVLRDESIDKDDIELVAPIDIKKINKSAISHVYPAPSNTQRYNASYLPFIEFFEEDFPWRYSPVAPDAKNKTLVPWLMLVAATEDEFTVSSMSNGVKKVSFKLSDSRYDEVFPKDGNELAKLAHVQIMMDDPQDQNPDMEVKLNNELDNNPEIGFSRLLCASKLPVGKKISVFLVPSFELGRAKGLGENTDAMGMTMLSIGMPWSKTRTEYPVYHQWTFYTSKEAGTFEELAGKLNMIPEEDYNSMSVNLSVDIADSGLLVPNMNKKEEYLIDVPAALRPKLVDNDNLKEEPKAYTDKLKEVLSKSPVFDSNNDNTQDPWIVPPVYGAQHLNATNLENVVVKDINLKVRNRIAAGMGSSVIRQNQESFVNRAWQKVEKINELNQVIREYCQMSRVNETAGGRITKKNKMLKALQSDAVVRILNNSKRFHKGFYLEDLLKRVGQSSNSSSNSATRQVLVNIAKQLNSDYRKIDISKILAYCNQNKISLPQNVIDTLARYNDKIYTRYTNKNVIKRKRISRMRNGKPEGFVNRESVAIYKGTTTTHGRYRKTGKTEAKGNEVQNEQNVKKVVRFLNTLSNACNNSLNEIANSGKVDQSYSDVMRSFSKKRTVGVTENELRSLVNPLVWDEVLKDKTNGQKTIEMEEINKFRQKFEFLSGILEPKLYVHDDIDEDGNSIKVSEFVLVKSKTPYIPSENHYFISDDCSKLLYRALQRENNSSTYKGFLWYYSVADEAARSNSDYFSRRYSLDGPTSQAFLPLVATARNTDVGGYMEHLGIGYIMKEDVYISFLKSINLYREGQKLPYVYFKCCEEDEEGNLIIEEKTKKPRTFNVYIVPHTYNTLTATEEQNQKKENGGIKYDIVYGKRYSFYDEGGISHDGHITIRYNDVGQALIIPGDNENDDWIFHEVNLNNFLTSGSWEIFLVANMLLKKQLFKIYVQQILHIALREPNSATLNIHPKLTTEIGYDFENGCIKKSGLITSNCEKDPYVEFRNRLMGTKIKINSDLHFNTGSSEPEDTPVDIEAEAADRIETILEKYTDIESFQLDEWKDYVKNGVVNSKYPVMAYPEYIEPSFFYLRQLSEDYILPSAGEIKKNTISVLANNLQFEESFLAGMNTEMGRELMWREYPTDQRGSYFRKFWDQIDLPDKKDLESKYYDIKKIHQWKKPLGENHMSSKGEMLVFAIKGDLMRVYPKTQVYLSEITADSRINPVCVASMTSWLSEDTYLVGFQGIDGDAWRNLCLTFQEEVESLLFSNGNTDLSSIGNSVDYAKMTQNRPSIYVLPLY